MKKIRNRKITVRYSDDELGEAKKRAIGNMAGWLRDLSLGQPIKKKPKPVNPNLLYELNRIGVNLNQISRYLNSKDSGLTVVEKAELLIAFISIEEELKEIRGKYDS